MSPRKIPMRSCIITKEKLPKQDLIRVVKNNEGTVEVDLTGKKNGRGAYLKKDLSVFEQAKKTKALNRKLEIEVPDSIFEELNNLIK